MSGIDTFESKRVHDLYSSTSQSLRVVNNIIIITLFNVGAKHSYVTIRQNEANLSKLLKLLNRKE